MTHSTAIDELVRVAEAMGNRVVEENTHWSDMKTVVYMKFPLSARLRRLGQADTRLRYYRFLGDLHYRPEEFFIDDLKKVAISFPLGKD